jgi:hypothetical protein
MKSPLPSDYTVKVSSSGVDVVFKPTSSEIYFGRASNGSLSPPNVRHAKSGDTGPYIEQEVLEMAQKLAADALRLD